jgi:hypothetical protein
MLDIKTETLSQQIHRQATTATIRDIAGLLQEVLSRRLTAYIAGVQDGKTVTRWANGEVTEIRDITVEQRLRTSYEIVRLMMLHDSPLTVRAWFIGMNPNLDSVSPADTIRSGNFRDALQAARAFSIGA